MTSKQILQSIESSFKPFSFRGIYVDGKARNMGIIKGKPFESLEKSIKKAAQENLLDTTRRPHED